MSEGQLDSQSSTNANDSAGVSSPTTNLLPGPLLGAQAGLLAAIAVAMVIEFSFPLFQVPAELINLEIPTPMEKLQEQEAAVEIVNRNHAIVASALLGAILSMSLVLATSLKRRNLALVVWCIPAIIIGGLIGASAGWVADFAFVQAHAGGRDMSPLTKTMLVLGAQLGLLGLGIGLAWGISLRSLPVLGKCVLGGILGGILSALLFPIITAFFLHGANTEAVFYYDQSARLLWLGLTSILIGLTATGLHPR